MAAMTARNVGVLLLVGLLLRANRQGLSQIGLGRTTVASESLYGVAALGGAFAVHLTASALLAMAVGLVRSEALTTETEHRAGAMNELLSTSSVPAFIAAMVVAAAFEEIAFRGFVVPRIQQSLRSWVAALLIVSVLFGIGHLYEGPLAVIQTAMLGSFFGLVLMWRGHLLSAILAHVGFNSIMMALALWLRHSGVL